MDFRPVPSRQFFHSLVAMNRDDRYECKRRNECFIPIMRDAVGYMMQAESDSERKVFLSHAEIYSALDNNKADVRYGYNSVSQQAVRAVHGDKTLDDVSEKDRSVSLWREQMVLRYGPQCEQLGKRLPFSEQVLKPYLAKWRKELINEAIDLDSEAVGGRADQVTNLKTYKRPSAKTFKRWYDAYHGCDMDVMALVPRHHGPGRKLFTYKPASIAFAHEQARAYLDRARPTKANTYRKYIAALQEHNKSLPGHRQLDKVSRKKFEAMIGKFDAFHVVASRFGEKYAIRKFMAIRRSFHVVAPGQRIEMDFVNVDLMSLLVETGIWNVLPPDIQDKIPRVRIYFGAAMDVAARYMLAFKASLSPNGASAVATIRMIMTDKRHLSTHVGAQTPWIGKIRPWFISHDNGAEFIAAKTQNVLRLARIEATRPPAGQPACRPFIERVFHTIGMLVAPYFDGRTFHNVVAKGDYDPQKHSSLLVEELIKIFIFAICDIYHNKPHDGLGGNTPHNAWVEACKEYEIDYPPGPAEMLQIFGYKTERRITPYGVTFMGITFDDPELQRMRTKYGETNVVIKFDPERISHVAFKTEKGWFVARNTVGLDDSVTLAEWIAARNELRAHYATAAEQGLKVMYEAINRLREIGEAATLRAGLSPRIPTAADFLKWESEVFGSWNAMASQDTPPLLQEGPLSDDPLHLGTVVNRPELFSKDKFEKAHEEVRDEDDDAADHQEFASSFADYEEDY
ncbi:Mu transposase C-terminal domain-containing protein [Ensifer sp. Root127]|uniref:Mu transposase C-terminal domain-containing protein n=1 Tax=Ensifer sp. Root127 TaxID=1736440 RepID=UPI00070A9323|nr:Mu transposase C-terminal domain-containing protein [Ensifer sp. Root127]KQW82055.1 integrase [Ensifer sp. Root127]